MTKIRIKKEGFYLSESFENTKANPAVMATIASTQLVLPMSTEAIAAPTSISPSNEVFQLFCLSFVIISFRSLSTMVTSRLTH